MKAVVDASVAVKWFVDESLRAEARGLLQPVHDLLAPDLVYAEVANTFRKKFRDGQLTTVQMEMAVRVLDDVFDDIIPCSSLVVDALRLAVELDHPIYDCFYLALARARDVPLVTADRVFAKRAHDAGLSDHIAILGADPRLQASP